MQLTIDQLVSIILDESRGGPLRVRYYGEGHRDIFETGMASLPLCRIKCRSRVWEVHVRSNRFKGPMTMTYRGFKRFIATLKVSAVFEEPR